LSPVQTKLSPELKDPAVAGQLPGITKTRPPPLPVKEPLIAAELAEVALKFWGIAVPSAPNWDQLTKSSLANGADTNRIEAKAGAEAKQNSASKTLLQEIIDTLPPGVNYNVHCD
jgi:hypothetical protein